MFKAGRALRRPEAKKKCVSCHCSCSHSGGNQIEERSKTSGRKGQKPQTGISSGKSRRGAEDHARGRKRREETEDVEEQQSSSSDVECSDNPQKKSAYEKADGGQRFRGSSIVSTNSAKEHMDIVEKAKHRLSSSSESIDSAASAIKLSCYLVDSLEQAANRIKELEQAVTVYEQEKRDSQTKLKTLVDGISKLYKLYSDQKLVAQEYLEENEDLRVHLEDVEQENELLAGLVEQSREAMEIAAGKIQEQQGQIQARHESPEELGGDFPQHEAQRNHSFSSTASHISGGGGVGYQPFTSPSPRKSMSTLQRQSSAQFNKEDVVRSPKLTADRAEDHLDSNIKAVPPSFQGASTPAPAPMRMSVNLARGSVASTYPVVQHVNPSITEANFRASNGAPAPVSSTFQEQASKRYETLPFKSAQQQLQRHSIRLADQEYPKEQESLEPPVGSLNQHKAEETSFLSSPSATIPLLGSSALFNGGTKNWSSGADLSALEVLDINTSTGAARLQSKDNSQKTVSANLELQNEWGSSGRAVSDDSITPSDSGSQHQVRVLAKIPSWSKRGSARNELGTGAKTLRKVSSMATMPSKSKLGIIAEAHAFSSGTEKHTLNVSSGDKGRKVVGWNDKKRKESNSLTRDLLAQKASGPQKKPENRNFSLLSVIDVQDESDGSSNESTEEEGGGAENEVAPARLSPPALWKRKSSKNVLKEPSHAGSFRR